MDGFQRAITSGITAIITVIALVIDWLTDLDIPVWIWLTWIFAVGTWNLWCLRTDHREMIRSRQRFDQYLDALLNLGEETVIGGVKMRVHQPDQCEGDWCCIHNPSDHIMSQWPQRWRDDIKIMERICAHGIGHPDPDDVAYRRNVGMKDLSIHGCDACCMEVE